MRVDSHSFISPLFAQKSSPSSLFAEAIANRYFNLEESEDKDSCTTEIYLNEDSTVTVGESDGPLHLDASGKWEQYSDGTFIMNLVRRFQAGNEEKASTDMGEFQYTVSREFVGEMSRVGACIAMTGSIHDRDEVFGDRQVGFFNMIDTTDARLGRAGDEPKKGMTRTS